MCFTGVLVNEHCFLLMYDNNTHLNKSQLNLILL